MSFIGLDLSSKIFFKQKRVVEEEKLKPIDLTMPGWGGWAGAGIDEKEIKMRRKKFARRRNNNEKYRRPLVLRPSDVVKTDKDREQLVRKDKDLDHVIISEKKDKTIASFQVEAFNILNCLNE